MELYAHVRRAVLVDQMSEREAARQFGLARETVRKMVRYSAPPESWRSVRRRSGLRHNLGVSNLAGGFVGQSSVSRSSYVFKAGIGAAVRCVINERCLLGALEHIEPS